MTETRVVPVILSGGSGTRLWPVSRESFPKQLWPLLSDHSLLQETALRATGASFAPPGDRGQSGAPLPDRRAVARRRHHRRPHHAGADRPQQRPRDRRRRAAGWPSKTPGAVLWMMAADSAIAGRGRAARHAGPRRGRRPAMGRIVTFGMRPTAPETGYGYIEVGDLAGRRPRRARAGPLRGKARPGDRRRAGGWRAASVEFGDVRLHRRHPCWRSWRPGAPDVLRNAAEAVAKRRQDLDFIRLDPDAFAACPNISLDYAVAERTSHAAVVPADLGWSDVGSWGALWEASPKDARGNVAIGDRAAGKTPIAATSAATAS